jgi:hypothetical protein
MPPFKKVLQGAARLSFEATMSASTVVERATPPG